MADAQHAAVAAALDEAVPEEARNAGYLVVLQSIFAWVKNRVRFQPDQQTAADMS